MSVLEKKRRKKKMRTTIIIKTRTHTPPLPAILRSSDWGVRGRAGAGLDSHQSYQLGKYGFCGST